MVTRNENVLTVRFDGKAIVTTPELTQYDTGQVISFEDINDGVEVHFANEGDQATLNKIIINQSVTIPDSLLETGKRLVAYVYMIGADSSETIKIIHIPIRTRTKPDDYIAPEDEPTFREQMEEIMNETEAIAQSVRDDADAGVFTPVKGQDYFTPEDIAEVREGLVPETRTVAEMPLNSNISSNSLANKIINAIKNSSDLIISFIPWLQTYTGTKTQQDTNTQNISLNYNAIGQNTQTIQYLRNTKADKTYVDETFTPKSRKIGNISLEYDITRNNLGSEVTYAFVEGGAWYSELIPWLVSKCGSKATDDYIIANKVDKEQGKGLSTNDYTTAEKEKLASLHNYDDTQVKQEILDTYSVKIITGSIVSIDDASNKPVKDLTVEIVPKQSGSGTPSPTNIRPLSGWENVKVKRLGKNLIDKNVGQLDVEQFYGIDISNLIEGKQYTFSSNQPITYFIISIQKSGTKSVYKEGSFTTFTFTMQRNANLNPNTPQYLFIKIGNNWVTSSQDLVNFNLQIEAGETATDYEPYNSQSTEVEINLGRTVYGGSLDVTTGILAVDRAIIDLGSLTWIYYSYSGGYLQSEIINDMYANDFAVDYADCYEVVKSGSISAMPDYSIRTSQGNRVLVVKDSRYTDGTAYATAINGNKAVYQLATPQTYQLTPTQINTLLGNNTIYADCGDSTLEYRQDSTRALAEKVDDVQIDGTSIVNNGVANIPKATGGNEGVSALSNTFGVESYTYNGKVYTKIYKAQFSEIKSADNTNPSNNRPIVPSNQHQSVFYGLAKAAGDTTQAATSTSTYPVGTYTPEAKTKIMNMLGDKYELISTDVLAEDKTVYTKAINGYENIMVTIDRDTTFDSPVYATINITLQNDTTNYRIADGYGVSSKKVITGMWERKSNDLVMATFFTSGSAGILTRRNVTSGAVTQVQVVITNDNLPIGTVIKIYGKGKV